MGWRFQKRIRLLPGVTLNLSRKGISTSIGTRGARVTLGHGKRRTTLGIPGSGLSYTNVESTKNARPSAQPQERAGRWLKLVLIAVVIFIVALLVGISEARAINKCTGADGKVTYQETACSTQAKDAQQVKTWVTEGYSEHRSSSSPARQEITPNLKLAGPPGSEALLGLYRRWADAERLAFSTSRIALSGPIASMQALQREAEATAVPTCLAPAQKTLTELIAKSTEAVLQFMGKQEVTAMAYQIVHRPKLIPAFETAVTQANCQ